MRPRCAAHGYRLYLEWHGAWLDSGLGLVTAAMVGELAACGLVTDYLNFPNASPFLAPLDRSMRFLDEKLQTFGQFWTESKVNATLNAWAIVNNLRTFLPDAKRAGKSLIQWKCLGRRCGESPGWRR